MAALDDKSEKRPVNWWEFWNSKVGLFILSGLFLTLIPFVYTNVQQYVSNQKEKEVIRVKLSTEIAHRIKVIQLLGTDGLRPYQVKDVRLATYGYREELKPEYYSIREVFSEFKEQTLIGLIIQLNNVTSEKGKQEANKQLSRACSRLKHFIDLLVTNPANRTRVDLNNENWTLEYAYQPAEKDDLNENLMTPIQAWLDVWR